MVSFIEYRFVITFYYRFPTLLQVLSLVIFAKIHKDNNTMSIIDSVLDSFFNLLFYFAI